MQVTIRVLLATLLVVAVTACSGDGASEESRSSSTTGAAPTSGRSSPAVLPAPPPTPNATEKASPYDAPTCPPHLPDAATTLTSLTGVVAVRLCPELNPNRDARWQPTAENHARLEDADALVQDVDDFIASVRAIPPGLPDYCATQRGPYVRLAFLFVRADGTRTLLAAPGCALFTIEGRRVDNGAVFNLYRPALERQRETLTYTRPFDDELTCLSGRDGGVRPGRERLVAAIACELPPGAESVPVDLQPIQLDSAQLAELDRAWSQPGGPLNRGPNGEHKCLDDKEPANYILAATDRSDVVQLIDTRCGFLFWHGSWNHRDATIPTTFAKLRLD